MPAMAQMAGWQYQRGITIQENSGETEPEPGEDGTESTQDTPGFAVFVAAAGVLLVVLLIKGSR
jgi:hypothetical protein